MKYCAFAPIVVSLLAATAFAHPISLSSAIVDIHEDKATVELEILLEDLVLYYQLKADKDYRFPAKELKLASEKHREFLLKYFSVRDAEGQRLTGKIVDIDRSKVPDEGVLQPELMRRALTYTLTYPLAKPQRFLTFRQNFGGDEAALPAMMDFMVFQKGVLLELSKQLTPKKPLTVKLDWKNPPTAPPNWRELRAKKQERFRKYLGITSYSGLYSFVYVNDREVRHEILVPLLTLESWLPIPRKDQDFLEVAEQNAMKKKLESFFRDRNPIKINGKPVRAKLSRMNFFGLDINDFAFNAKPRRVSVYQARLGLILSYPTKTPPTKVEMAWETFNEYAAFLRSVVFAYNDKSRVQVFTKDAPNFTWTGEKKAVKFEEVIAPETAKLLAKTGTLNSDEADKVSKALLKNVYRAFSHRDDGRVYDALAKSASGDLLRRLFLQFKRSLMMAEQGGAVARVEQVKVVDGKQLSNKSSKSFVQRLRWRVTGTVEHWGHIHTRENEYEADFTIAATGTGWKITDYDFRSQKRIRFETGLRMLKE